MTTAQLPSTSHRRARARKSRTSVEDGHQTTVGRSERRRRWRTAGFAATAFALAVAMLATTLPTPLYGLYRQQFGFSELMVTLIFATYAAGVIVSLVLFRRGRPDPSGGEARAHQARR